MQHDLELDQKTLEELRQLRVEMGVETYDEVLEQLLAMRRKGARPVKGLTPGIGPFTRE